MRRGRRKEEREEREGRERKRSERRVGETKKNEKKLQKAFNIYHQNLLLSATFTLVIFHFIHIFENSFYS